MRAHAGEDEDGTGSPIGTAPPNRHALRGSVAEVGAKPAREFLARGAFDGDAVVELRAVLCRGRRESARSRPLRLIQRFRPSLRHEAECPFGAGRDGQQAGVVEISLRFAGFGRCRGAQDRMGIGAAVAEGVDPDVERAVLRVGDLPRLERQLQSELREGNRRIGLVEVDLARNFAVSQAEASLDQARDTGRGFEMADIGLDRTDDQRLDPVPIGPHGSAEGRGLERVADRRPGAVRLDVADGVERHPGLLVHPTDERFLGFGTRYRDAVGPPVLVDARAADDGMDAVAVTQSLVESLQEHDAATLAARVAIRLGVETLAMPVASQKVALAHDDRIFRRQHHVDAAGHCQIAFARQQTLTGIVQRDQGRRTGRVHGDARAAKIEDIGQARRQHGHGSGGGGVMGVQ